MRYNLPISSKDGFESVFQLVEHEASLDLVNPYHLNIYSLSIDSNAFSLDSLYNYVKSNIGRYVFSRAMMENYRIEQNLEAVGLDAVEKLRSADNPNDPGAGGELGEILLYLFLEQVCGAPKILSKIELKTGNQYIYSSDGVHFLSDRKNGIQFYQLIFGESKIIGDIKKAIDNAFRSIVNTKDNPSFDISLINSQIFKEAFDQQTIEFLTKLIIPSPNQYTDKNFDTAFGVFIGYSFDIESKAIDNIEYRNRARKKISQDIADIQPYLMNKIRENNLGNHSFYFYFLPFNNAARDRAYIINRLKGGQKNG